MARRRRLSDVRSEARGGPEALPDRPAPIAQLAGDAAASAALDGLAEEVALARAEGRFAQALPLDAVAEDYLVRDRLAVDADALEALEASLTARGQQVPIEVVDLGAGRYGLISGWRRLTALRRLYAATGDGRFARVLAVLRQPETAAAAYLAMVEENEVRAGLSYYERARIVARSVEQGAFKTEKAALQGLFATASRARRSKIGAFLRIYQHLDGILHFPAALGERLGLTLSRALEARPDLAKQIARGLTATRPADPAAEAALLQTALRPSPEVQTPAPPRPKDDSRAPSGMGSEAMAGGIDLRSRHPLGDDLELGQGILEGAPCVILRGTAVDAAFVADLRAFLDQRKT